MDGVIAARVKRMATAEAFQSHPDAAQATVFCDRLQHVFRAGWIVAAS